MKNLVFLLTINIALTSCELNQSNNGKKLGLSEEKADSANSKDKDKKPKHSELDDSTVLTSNNDSSTTNSDALVSASPTPSPSPTINYTNWTQPIVSLEARKANGSSGYGAAQCTDSTWYNLASSSYHARFVNWSSCGSTNGWNGDGSIANPYVLRFNNSTQHIDFPTSRSLAANNWSVEGVFKTSKTISLPNESISGIVGHTGQNYLFYPFHFSTTLDDGPFGNGTTTYQGLSIGTNGVVVCEHGSGHLPCPLVKSMSIGTGWNHYVLTLQNKIPKVYVNGVLVKTGLTSGRANIYLSNMIGNEYRNTYGSLSGDVAIARFFTNVISETEILDRCNDERSVYGFSCGQ